ncbi:YqaJ viral recombinase family protein [Tsukamurella sp. DT100]|uniref:YqaJ viral recombinase family nuclease n=1 Tax=Tsukamurella sp. DT100 TaxID=3393415 RepID=UPI003CF0EA43
MTAPFWAEHAELAGHYKDRAEWLELRRTGIGSSDCSAILGLGKYGSPFSVWVDKTARGVDDDGPSEAMEWGNILEPVIRDEFARRTELDVTACPTLRSLERPWQLYNPDGLVLTENVLVEIKNASQWLAHEWVDGEVPDHAELQVQHGCAVTGADGAYVVGLVGGNRLRWEFVPRDDELIALINEAEARLWDEHIVPDVQPAIDGSSATEQAIGAVWARQHGVERVTDRPLAVADAVLDYRVAQADEKAALARKAKAKNELLALMQGADVLTDEAGEPLVRLQRGQFREKDFMAEEPTAPEWLHKVEVVDRARMKTESPDLFRRYQSVSIRIPNPKKK